MEFALLLFSILGIQIWRGLTHYHCRLTPEPSADGQWAIDPDNTRVCGGFNTCDLDAGQVCGSLYAEEWMNTFDQSKIQPEEMQSVDLNFGITNFDNIF